MTPTNTDYVLDQLRKVLQAYDNANGEVVHRENSPALLPGALAARDQAEAELAQFLYTASQSIGRVLSPSAEAIQAQVTKAVAAVAFSESAAWFNKNDPDGDQYFPSFKLREMADGQLLAANVISKPNLAFKPEGAATGYAMLGGLIEDALAWRAMKAAS